MAEQGLFGGVFARAGLDRVRGGRLAVQFGGAAGTLASLGADGPRVVGDAAQAQPGRPGRVRPDPAGYLGAAGEFTDAALAAHGAATG